MEGEKVIPIPDEQNDASLQEAASLPVLRQSGRRHPAQPSREMRQRWSS